MKVICHKEVDVNCCDDCPYCRTEQTMEGLYAHCQKLIEIGVDPFESFIGGPGHTVFQCIDERCPLLAEEKQNESQRSR